MGARLALVAANASTLHRGAGLIDSYSWRIASPGHQPWRDPEVRQAPSIAASTFLPRGSYTTVRTLGGTGLVMLSSHLRRLEESAALLGHAMRLDRQALRPILCDILSGTSWEGATESRVRLTLDCSRQPGDLWVSVEPLATPPLSAMEQGVAVLTRRMHRENPLAKNSAWLEESREARDLLGGEINEVLMVAEEGQILEGLSSNFFAIRDGNLYTAEEGILPGITRSLVLDEAQRAGIPVRREAISYEEIQTLEEAFLSSSGRGILPIIRIDAYRIGDGVRGSITRRLQERYNARMRGEVEWVCTSDSDSNEQRSSHG